MKKKLIVSLIVAFGLVISGRCAYAGLGSLAGGYLGGLAGSYFGSVSWGGYGGPSPGWMGGVPVASGGGGGTWRLIY
jgi:hypothetical protein